MNSYLFEINSRIHGDNLNDFLSKDISVAKAFKNRKREFLAYQDSTGISNLDRIWRSLTPIQKREIDTLYEDMSEIDKDRYKPSFNETINYPLNDGCTLLVPKDDAYNELASIEGKDLFLEYQDSEQFLDDSFKFISQDPLYRRVDEIRSKDTQSNIVQLHQNAQVWVYSKAFDKIINITPLMNRISIDSSDFGGSFSITTISSYSNFETLRSGDSVIHYGSVLDFWQFESDVYDKELNTSSHFNWIQQNDIVFISFERLLLEEVRSLDTFIDQNEIAGKVWDMIGLVDSVRLSHNVEQNYSITSINGRDLSKLLEEDGSYFYPYAIMGQVDNFFLNTQDDKRFLKRLFGSGKYYARFAYMYPSIKDSLGFIFNHLTNTSIAPNTLFSCYEKSRDWVTGEIKDRTTKAVNIINAGDDYLSEVEVNGVWKIIKLLVDNNISDRRLTSSGISKPDGSLLETIHSICQSPFVEFFGDTYLDQYTFISRQPPFTQNSIIEAIKNCISVSSDMIGGNIDLMWEQEYYSYFQLESTASLLGTSTYGHLANLPVVYFPEYISNFGNHRKVIPSKYISNTGLINVGSSQDNDLFRNAVINDLVFLIEIYSYLPFTQKGSITIKGGDRRIKKNTWIYIESIDSYAYVDTVSNQLSASESNIDRSTDISFSRCMRASYIKPREMISSINIDAEVRYSVGYSYFNIINIDLIKKTLLDKFNGVQKITENFTVNSFVNRDQFEFFLKRRQLL